MKRKYICDCPHGGDHSEDCKDCVYSPEYHLVDGECTLRTSEPTEAKFEALKEVI
jgi:hypothetical protein